MGKLIIKGVSEQSSSRGGCFVFISSAAHFLLSLLSLCRQLIYNYPEQLFAQAGVMAIEHADFAGVERLALVTGMHAHTEMRS